LVGRLEGREVRAFSDRASGDGNETVVRGFVGVFVNKTSRVDTSHLSVVQSGDFLEFTGVGVASVLRQEKWETIASEVLDLLVPARGGV